MGMPFGFPGGFQEEDDEDEDDYEDSDDESCPPLERVGGGGVAAANDDDDGEDSDGSMPPLEPVRHGVSNSSDDDDDSLPDLQGMDGGVVRDNEEGGEDSDDDSMPPLMPREAESDDDDDDDMRPRTGNVSRASPAARSSNATGNRGSNVASAVESDSDDGCPALERVEMDDISSDEEPTRGRANVATGARGSNDDDDDDSMPELTPRGDESGSEGGRGNQQPRTRGGRAGHMSDDGSTVPPSEISEIDEDEDEEEIPFPVLDRVGNALRAPTTFTREEYLALPEAQRNLGAGGAWIMIPSSYNEDYSTLVYTNDVKCVHIGVYARESRLIVNENRSVLVSSPQPDSTLSSVSLVSLEESENKYEVPTNAQCVSDGDGGLWALTPTGGTKELSYYSADSPSGSVVHMLPESSYLVMDPMGGVWAHVRKSGNVDVEPGLYYYVFGMGHNLISQPDQNAKCTTGADGVCVMTTLGGQVQVSNVVLGETARPVSLKNCAASKDIRIVPREKEEGDRALYVHCRVKNRWKLCLLDESGRFSDICDSPKDARVVGDGKGGAWIFKRTGASHQMRMLTFVSSSGATREHGLSFPPGSKIAGL